MSIAGNKKGMSIGTLILVIIGLGVILVLAGNNIRKAWNMNTKILPNVTTDSKSFNFYADSVAVIDEGNCTGPTAVNNIQEYECTKFKYIQFKTTVRNEYGQTPMLKMYGGFIACPVTCKSAVCSIIDKNCFTTERITSTKPCYVSHGETKECASGSKAFDPGTYQIYPLAQCDMVDKTSGCFKNGMTTAATNAQNTYIKIIVKQ